MTVAYGQNGESNFGRLLDTNYAGLLLLEQRFDVLKETDRDEQLLGEQRHIGIHPVPAGSPRVHHVDDRLCFQAVHRPIEAAAPCSRYELVEKIQF